MTAIDLPHLQSWVGRQDVREQVIDPFPARALAALLNREQLPTQGDALPLPWHWLYFLDTPLRSAIGCDGHPARGSFLPPVPLPRRMWAAGHLKASGDLHIGEAARRTSTVRSVELKEGKTGALVFVTVEHLLEQGGRVCLHEEQHIVYRDAPTGPAPLPPGEAAQATADWTATLVPDPALLFRYSALTYNGHRIHYDRDYAVQQEFYPGLVVHGPLIATLLLDLLQREQPAAAITDFRFRALRPAFEGEPMRLCSLGRGQEVDLWTSGPQDKIGMRMNATLAQGALHCHP